MDVGQAGLDSPYRMILVDDEDEVRGRISSRISHATGFTVVASAGNGHDALDLIEEHAPHVVLTDIRMPYIDGLELAAIVRRDYPTVKVAFITGYNDFDYAREAIELGVHSYLTKPVTQEALESYLAQLRNELDVELRETFSREMIERQYAQSVPLLIEHALATLLVSSDARDPSGIERLREYGVDLDERPYVTAVVMLDRLPDSGDVITFEKLRLSVRSLVENVLGSHRFHYHSFFMHETIACVVSLTDDRGIHDLDIAMNQVIRRIERYLGVGIAIGVSENGAGFVDFRRSYEHALQAVRVARLSDGQSLLHFGQLVPVGHQTPHVQNHEREQIEHLLGAGDDGALHEYLTTLFGGMGLAGTSSAYRTIAIDLIGVLVRHATSVGADLVVLNGGDLLETQLRLGSAAEFRDWFVSIAGELAKARERARMDNAERLLNEAVAYIDRMYADKDLTMQRVCDTVGISVSYLGQLFKKYRATTFVKYLTSVRMERAKEHLSLRGGRVMEVAEACGYRDVYYFSHCFRKYAGVPPKQYRDARS